MLEIHLLASRQDEVLLANEATARLKLPVHVVREVVPLDADSKSRVYLVPLSLLETDEWAASRTRLAQANRYFVGLGVTPATKDIVRIVRDGAFDVVTLADSAERWREASESAAKAQATWLELYGGSPLERDALLVGVSEPLLALRRAIDRIGPTTATVLLIGESGVGKEKVAQALHQKAAPGPFVAINCATLPANLIEAELFGVARGAFTHAQSDRPGLVEQAQGGTLLLDEIGELDLSLQAKLLRFLETRKARRLGSNQEYAVDLRVIAATNRDLQAEAAAGRFRADLYYRLAEVILSVPPLRQRPADIPLLARHFLAQACERFGKFFDTIEPELIRRWQEHPWTGNVRELKTTVDRLVLLHDGPTLRANGWEPPPSGAPRAATSTAEPSAMPPVAGIPPARLPSRRDRLERARQLLAEPGHDLTWIAAQAGVHPTTLFRWRKAGRI